MAGVGQRELTVHTARLCVPSFVILALGAATSTPAQAAWPAGLSLVRQQASALTEGASPSTETVAWRGRGWGGAGRYGGLHGGWGGAGRYGGWHGGWRGYGRPGWGGGGALAAGLLGGLFLGGLSAGAYPYGYGPYAAGYPYGPVYGDPYGASYDYYVYPPPYGGGYAYSYRGYPSYGPVTRNSSCADVRAAPGLYSYDVRVRCRAY
jgi:hypothetical protein